MAATGNEIVKLSQLKWFKENVVAGMVSQTIAEEASEREKQDGLLEDQIVTKIGPSNIKAGTGISVSQSGNDVTVTSTVRDTNTTYTLSKTGSTIKLTGSDGSSTTVTDADTKYTLPTASGTTLGGVKVGSNITNLSGTISLTKANVTAALGYTPPTQDTNTWIALKGATSSTAGTAGYAPAPSAGASNRYLRSDGTWAVPPDTNTTYSNATSSTAGLMSSADKAKLDGISPNANNYSLPDATSSVKGGVRIGSGISVSGGTISTSLSNLGVTASAAELNYMDGVTSNVQSQLNGKAASTHKHAAADISSGTLSVDRLPTIPLSKGGTGATSAATARTALGVQNPPTAPVVLTNQNLNSYTTEAQCGYYYAGGGNTVSGKPSGVEYFGMWMMHTASGVFTQILYDNSGKIWTRSYSSSAWSTWTALVRTTDTIAKAASATNATNATKATQDSAGQQINTTYVKSVTASGRTVTVTKGDGKTSTFQTQDTTYGNMGGASTSAAGKAGLVPAPSQGSANRYLRSDGTWQVPPDTNTTYSDMKGATSSTAGTHGLVPAPATGANNRYLRSDGTWAVPPDTNTTYSAATTSTAGLMSASDKTKLDGISPNANNYSLPDATSSVKGGVRIGSGISVSGGTISTSLSNLGVTASAAELNYMDGVTSNVQSQLNGKAASTHKHAAADISSGTLSVDRLPTIPLSKGGTGATSAATARTALGVQNPPTAPVVLTNQNLNSYTTEAQCGYYYAGGGNTVSGKPSGVEYFGMWMMHTASGVFTQILYDNSGKIWTRSYSSSAWSTWTALVRTTDTIAKAASATKLQTARTISLTGNVTGSASFNGTANASITATIANNAVTTARIADKAVTPAKMASDPVYIVTSASSSTSISGKTVVKPCILVVVGTNPPQIIYDDGK